MPFRSTVVGFVTLAAFVATLGLPFVAARHGLGADPDLGWGGVRIAVAHPLTQVEPVQPAVTDEHCAICHWARTFGSSVTATPVRHTPPITAGAIVAALPDGASTLSRVVGPPRGPPAGF